MSQDFYRHNLNQLHSLCEGLRRQEISLEKFIHEQWQVVEHIRYKNVEFWEAYRSEVHDLEILLAARIDSLHQMTESDLHFVEKISHKLTDILSRFHLPFVDAD